MSTSIICKINDSAGVPLVGFIRVIADYLIADDVSQTVTVPVFRDTNLVNGECTLNVAPSSRAKASYLFEVWSNGVAGLSLAWSFRAIVPDSIVPISLTDLQSTGITKDALDSSLLTITRRILADETFWAKLKGGALNFKGAFNLASYYRRGDCVVWEGSSYIMTHDGVIQGIYPNNTDRWLLIAAKGEVAAFLTGDTDPYNAERWQFSTNAPSKSAVHTGLSQKLWRNDDRLVNCRATNTDVNDVSEAIANTKFVKDNMTIVRNQAGTDADAKVIQTRAYVDATADVLRTYADNKDNALLNTTVVNDNAIRDNILLRLPQPFDNGVFINGTKSANLPTNTWQSVFRQTITIRASGSHSVIVNPYVAFRKTSVDAIFAAARVRLNGQVSDGHVQELAGNFPVTMAFTAMFQNVPAGVYGVDIQVLHQTGGLVDFDHARLTTVAYY